MVDKEVITNTFNRVSELLSIEGRIVVERMPHRMIPDPGGQIDIIIVRLIKELLKI